MCLKFKKLPELDMLLTTEAKVSPLVAEMARLLGVKKNIMARKSIKPYMSNPIVDEVVSITTDEK